MSLDTLPSSLSRPEQAAVGAGTVIVPAQDEQIPDRDRPLLLGIAATGGRVLATALVIIALAVFLFLAVGPRFLGYQTSTMLSASMAPVINAGDVVVSTRTATADLKAGDIVTYSIPVDDHRVITHRVVEVTTHPNGTVAVRTKGDANNDADPWTAILADDHVHTTTAVIPHLGQAIRALSDPAVRMVLLYGAPTLLVLALLRSIWRRDPAKSGTATTSVTAARGSR